MKTISIHKQGGAALIIGLIILMTLTLIGVSSMGSMTTQLKIAANSQDYNTAFQGAAAGIATVQGDPTIDWTDISGGVQTRNYTAPDNSSTAVANVTYADCRVITLGYSLTSTWRGVIHEIDSTGTALDGALNPISQNIQVLGQQTVRPGC